MAYIGIILGLIAIGFAWQLNKKTNLQKEHISDLSSKLYKTRRELLTAQEETNRTISQLRFELMKAQGTLQITADMTIDELTLAHPQAPQVLAGFHIGGCSSCAADGSERLDLVAARSGQDVEPILVALNSLIAESSNANGQISEDKLKTPNVQLMF